METSSAAEWLQGEGEVIKIILARTWNESEGKEGGRVESGETRANGSTDVEEGKCGDGEMKGGGERGGYWGFCVSQRCSSHSELSD